jgi:hypothetical protein
MDQIPTTTGKPQVVAVIATRTLLRAFIMHLPKCRLPVSIDALKNISRCYATGGAVRAVLEVLITKRRPTKWEWRVCDRSGTTIMGGFESTRPAAKYRGNRALFLLLSTRWAR